MSMREKVALWFESRSVIGCVLVICAAFSVLIFSMDHSPVYLFLRMVVCALWAGTLIRWWPGVWLTLKTRVSEMGSGEHLALGIWISFSGSLMISGYAVVQRYYDYAEWTRDWWLINAIIGWQIIGVMLHLTAPGLEDGRVPPRNWGWIAIATAIGGGLAGVLVALSVDL